MLYIPLLFLVGCVHALPLAPRSSGFELPITRRTTSLIRRGGAFGTSGLGNNNDLLYTVPVRLGGTVLAVHLDTGSSDLWVVSDACTISVCQNSTATRYPTKSLNPTGASVNMEYGDSTTGTFAAGPIAKDVASIAGIAIKDQTFGAINSTSNPTILFGASGIFGLGFPAGSSIQSAVVNSEYSNLTTTDHLIHSTPQTGPLLSRVVTSDELLEPMFAISLQRNTIDVSGQGVLSVGKLPEGVRNSSLTWVPVRLYSADEGGLRAPTFAPNEVFPLRWEVDLEGVFLDGVKLPATTLPGASKNRATALIDTGNSLIRGPQDLVTNVLSQVSSSYAANFGKDLRTPALLPCVVPRRISFQIGGKVFPVDPRDFIGSIGPNNAETCVADNLVATDAPAYGSLFQWSLGDPFLKSNLVAFHYGNLTHPSVDPPRIGFLSLVPENADALLAAAVNDAVGNGGNFELKTDAAPLALAATRTDTTITVTRGPQPTSHSDRFTDANARGSSSSPRRFLPVSLYGATVVLASMVLVI